MLLVFICSQNIDFRPDGKDSSGFLACSDIWGLTKWYLREKCLCMQIYTFKNVKGCQKALARTHFEFWRDLVPNFSLYVKNPSVTIGFCHWVERRMVQEEHLRKEGSDPGCSPGKDSRLAC